MAPSEGYLDQSCYNCIGSNSYFIPVLDEARSLRSVFERRGMTRNLKYPTTSSYSTTFFDDPYYGSAKVINVKYSNLDTEYFSRRNANPKQVLSESYYVVGIVSATLNITDFIRKYSATRPGFVAYFDSNHEASEKLGNIRVILTAVDASSFVYCESKSAIKGSDMFSVVLMPFDMPTWIAFLIVLVCLSCWLGGVWKGVDVVWAVLGQLFQHKYTGMTGIIMTSLALLMVIIQTIFSDVLTSCITKPFLPVYFKATEDLYRAGYKILIPPNESLSEYVNYYKKLDATLLKKTAYGFQTH